MTALQVKVPGGAEVLIPVEVDRPRPGPGEVLIRNAFIGVNFVDLQQRAGHPYPVTFPLIPGIEASGTVVETGGGSGILVGDRVAYAGGMPGVYAEFTVLRAESVVRLPRSVDFEQAASALLQGTTAQILTTQVHRLQRDDWVLVHSAASGVGAFIVQLAVAAGCRVIGTTSQRAKVDAILALGARCAVVNSDSEWGDRVLAFTGGQGVRVAYDAIGGSLLEPTLETLAARGHLVEYGQSGGVPKPLDITRLSGLNQAGQRGSLSITWASAGDYRGKGWHRAARRLLKLVAKGQLKLPVRRVYSLVNGAQAHRDMASGSGGKILLRP